MSRFRGLFGRLLGLYLLIVVATLGVLGVLLSRLLQDYFFAAKQQDLVRKGAAIAALAAPLYRHGADTQAARQQLEIAGRLLTGGALVIDRQARVLQAVGRRAPVDETDSQMPCPVTKQLPDLMEVMKGRVVTRTGYSPIFRESAFFAAVPVTIDGAAVGAVIMHSPVLGMRDTVVHVRLLVFGLALAAIVFSTLLGSLLARSVADPLRRMSKAAGQMAAGDFETRVPERGAAEVSQLGAALNRMSASLRDTIHSLTEERSKLDHIVTTMGEGVIAVDRSRRVLMANPQAEALLSRDGMARIGQQLPEGPLAAAFHHVMGESREQTIALTASNGRTLQAHISPTAVEGSTIGAVGVVQDVTELHRVERMRRQFVADASHQLRSPLTAMQGHAEALLDEVASDEATRRRYLAAIVRDSRRLNRLIEQLLDLSQLESGHARLTLRPLTVPALVNRIVGSIDTLEQQPKVIVHIATDLPPALADESYTEQALLNLLANALHYTPPEGRVTVWARPEAGAIRVGVTDTGKGIAPEHLPHIWERFYRAEESGRDGTGLGLAIVKSLVERQGGQVSAESRLGAGSTFSFTLPPAPQQDPSYSLDPPLTLP